MRVPRTTGIPETLPGTCSISSQAVQSISESVLVILGISSLILPLRDPAEAAGFDVMVKADQNIKYQQNLAGRKLALVVLGSNIWPIVRDHGAAIGDKVGSAAPGSYCFIEMPVPPRRSVVS
jgi:hypothetical protein